MICFTTTVSWLSTALLLALNPINKPVYIRDDDSLKIERGRLTAHIRQLDHTDVLSLLPRFMQVCPAVAFTVPCIPPVGAWDHNRLSSPFGGRVHPIRGQYKHHEGVDIAGPHQYVRSTASGTIIEAGYERGLGLHVLVDHGNSYQTLYGHLALITCKVGQEVEIGHRLGVLGRTGQATGLHLHYAVRKSGRYVNPDSYMTIGLKIVAQSKSLVTQPLR